MRMQAGSARSAAAIEPGGPVDVCDRLAYIMGTSACIMATTVEPCFVPGVWGPYYSGMVPGLLAQRGRAVGCGRRRSIICCARIRPMPRRVAAARSEGVDVIEFLERRIIARAGKRRRGGEAGARRPRAARISRQPFALCRSRFAAR